MPVKIRQIGPCFAGEIDGIDPAKPLSPAEVDAIHAGMDEYAVLVFHGRPMTQREQLDFTRSLGELEHSTGTSLRAAKDIRLPSVFADVSNLDKDEKPFLRGGSSPSATASGIPTAPSRRRRRSIRCSIA